MKLSVVQKQALDPRFSCWVEASAGTGKTKVLIDRILSLLLSGSKASDILCLTFTKAAGAEMANRLRYRLNQWVNLDDRTLKVELEDFLGDSFSEEFLDKARQLLGSVLDSSYGVRIQTIHGFCQSLLRMFPLEARLLPHFKIMDDTEKQQVIEESYSELWKELEDSEIALIVHHLSEPQFHQFLNFFLSHKDVLSKTPLKELVNNLTVFLDLKMEKSNLLKEFFQRSSGIDESVLSFEKATVSDLKLCQSLIDFDQASLEEKETRFYDYKSLFLTTTGSIRKRFFSKPFGGKFPGISAVLEEEADRVFRFHQSSLKQKICERSTLLMRVATKFIKIYEAVKSQKAWIDYDDLILRTRNLLRDSSMKPWILEKLDHKLNHILVDEAQDTSQIQWDLILTLIEEFYTDNAQNTSRTFFVVGDLKQSIYSFQGACPQAFEKAKESFQKLPLSRTIDLETSYRSTPAILQFVDQTFKSMIFHQSKNSPSVHQVSRHEAPGIVEMWPLISQEKQTNLQQWKMVETQSSEESVRRLLAKKIAFQLEAWFKNGESLHSQNRLLEPRDIMILVRRRDAFMEELVKALKARAIPVTGLDRMVLTDQLVVKDLLCLCDVLLLPEDDLSFATLLKSPLFGIGEDEIFQLCQQRQNQSLWAYLQMNTSYEKITTQVLKLQEIAASTSPYSFFNFILGAWGGKQRLLERLGTEIEDVLEEFLSVCQEYELSYGVNLQLFVCWIRQQNIEVKRSLEQTEENKVRVITVHGAKGLQAPVVFLPDTTQLPASKSSLHWNENPAFLLWADRESRQVPELDILFEKDRELQEYYRLLYVALTRAEDRLYICGWESQKGVDPQSWYSLLESTLQQMGNSMDIEGIGQGRRYGTLPEIRKETEKPTPSEALCVMPEWLKKPWTSEKYFPFSSSNVETKPAVNFLSSSLLSVQREKGILIHKILQWVVRAEETYRASLVKKYVSALSLSAKEKTQIQMAIETVLLHPDFPIFFNKKTQVEVPIQGYVECRPIRVILDVLTVDNQGKKVHILDYKTGAFLESYRLKPPLEYVQQMSTYKKLVQDIYPEYEVVSFLLWTEIGWIQNI
ncbi:MAG: double-strand break repair helicase AddA [Alphaproteobacteria bacterium RIFCSPHIGHO2_01_FULL_41_14]|nr:MAG: double-strand break repair helicase AddA [Alphaproteobacteria bacterium GWB1_45_5]OFW76272.1 MAG: double-strand break repair helicase AddA [Alphaproteobacteria bacterium GWA1_45_9]OFW89456.1 MAG: double-strand break repair helicase AddA [Alphaproteobacteria bacterium RIFCSPHIGHO2_01_FULL_41_14]HCI48643.1 double-strand break repair helicase AddA [Holosporales bacterium]